MAETIRTAAPWGWQKMGEWMLVGQHSMRPIVLSARLQGPMKERGFTSLVGGLLVPFDPQHPDAKVIGAGADLGESLLEMLRDGEGCVTGNPVCSIDCCRYGRARAALQKAGLLK